MEDRIFIFGKNTDIMKNLFQLAVSLLIVLLSSSFLFSQNWESPCGTPDIRKATLLEYQKNREHIASMRSNDPIYVKMKIHLVGNDDGDGYYPLRDLMRSFCKLNEDMATAGIKMELDPDINYIASSRYYIHNFSTGAQMMSQHNVSGMVNCYIVADPAGNCGYYSPGRDGVALKKTCLGSGSATWSHELGHFFSLPHTFSGWEGEEPYEYGTVAPDRVGNRNRLVELADSSNCRSAGDGFCDTRADYIGFRWGCTNGGESPGDLMDPDSVSFRAEGANIMSYSLGQCATTFSEDQADAMEFDITRGRINHISNNDIPDPIDFQPEDFEAVEGFDEEPLQYDEATIRWKSIEGADYYLVDITKVLPFATKPTIEYFTADTFINLEPLEIDFSYDWEVYPFHPGDGCSVPSDKNRFLATQISSSQDLFADTGLKIFPNPIKTGSQFNVSYQTKNAGSLDWELYDSQGKTVRKKRIEQFSGSQRIEIQSPDAPGLYLLQLRHGNEVTARKIIVQ